MTDTTTNQRLVVSTIGTSGPFLVVPVTRLPEVRDRLDRHKVRYWTDASAIALDGVNFITTVNFGLRGDAAKVQAILDDPAGAADGAGG